MGIDQLFSTLKISAMGLSAQRQLMDATASNIANVETTDSETGGPYVPRRVRFQEIQMNKNFGQLVRNALSQRRNENRIIPVRLPSETLRDTETLTSGVQAESYVDTTESNKRIYDPDHPSADAEGFVEKPNINLVDEMVNLMAASRMYEANVSVMNAAKQMAKKALDI